MPRDEDDHNGRVVYRYRPQVLRSLFVGFILALGGVLFFAAGVGIIPVPDVGFLQFLKKDIARTVLTILGAGWVFFALFIPVSELILAFGSCKIVLSSRYVEFPRLFGNSQIPWRRLARVVISPLEVNTGGKKIKVVGYMLRMFLKKGGFFGQRMVSSTGFDNERHFFHFVNEVLIRSNCKWEEKSMPLAWLQKVDAEKLEKTLEKWL